MSFKSLADRPLCFLDCETTGLDPDLHEIIDFAACKVVNGAISERKQFKIRPENLETASPKALEINGYDPVKWEKMGALSMKEALPEIVDFITDTTIVGQNPFFDMGMIKGAVKRAGMDVRLPYHCIDTVTLAYEHLVPCGLEKLSLVNICEFLGIEHKKAHTAMGDVDATMAVYFKLLRSTWLDRLGWRLRRVKKKNRKSA